MHPFDWFFVLLASVNDESLYDYTYDGNKLINNEKYGTVDW